MCMGLKCIEFPAAGKTKQLGETSKLPRGRCQGGGLQIRMGINT